MTDLQHRLLAAHAAGDPAALIPLYREAAQTAQNADAAGFFLTHAYVFALEAGHPDAPGLREDLIAQGRETPV